MSVLNLKHSPPILLDRAEPTQKRLQVRWKMPRDLPDKTRDRS
jgi:hypothetical protein